MRTCEHAFTLDAKGSDEAVDMVAEQLEQGNYKHEDALRLRLAFDSMLIRWREAGLEGYPCELFIDKHRFSSKLCVAVDDVPSNVASSLDDPDEGDEYLLRISAAIGVDWTVSVTAGRAFACVALPRHKMDPLASTFLAIALAVVCHLVLQVLPAGVEAGVMDVVVNPLYDAIIGLLSAVVCPFLFFSLVSAFVGMGSLGRLRSIGGRLLGRFTIANTVVASIAAVLCAVAFGLGASSAQTGGSGLTGIEAMVFDIVPSNLVDPFLQGNTLQVVFLATAFGVCLLVLGREVPTVLRLVDELNRILTWGLNAVLTLIPAFILLSALRLLVTASLEQLVPFALAFALFVVAMVIYVLASLVLTSRRCHVGILALARACLPGALVALASASSTASYGALEKTLKEDLHVDPGLADISLPLGITFYKTGVTPYIVCVVAFALTYQGDALTVPTLVMGVVLGVILGMACPSVPGGMILGYSALFMQFGISMDILAIITAVEVLSDAIGTSLTVFAMPLSIASESCRTRRGPARPSR